MKISSKVNAIKFDLQTGDMSRDHAAKALLLECNFSIAQAMKHTKAWLKSAPAQREDVVFGQKKFE